MERTNTRFKHQSEQFWVAEKTTKGGGALKRPAPLCVFLGSQNSSNCCLNLVFVLSILWFNLLILCWLAGANDELYFWKFIPNSKFGFWSLGILRLLHYKLRTLVALRGQKFMKKSTWAEKSSFFKIALKRVLTLPKARSRKMRQLPLKNMGLQNKNISVVTKHWKYRISVPMSYISVPMPQNMDATCRSE